MDMYTFSRVYWAMYLLVPSYGFLNIGVLPGKSNYIEGEVIDVNCTVPDDYVGTHTSQNITFTLGLEDLSDHVTPLTETVANLRLPHQGASNRHLMIMCYLMDDQQDRKPIGMKMIMIGRLPKVPDYVTCKVIHYEVVICSWLSYHQTENYTKFHNEVYLNWSLNRERWSPCPELSTSGCTWILGKDGISYGDHIYMQISVNNTLGRASTEIMEVDTTHIAQPQRVGTIDVSNITSTSVQLSWKHTNMPHKMSYEVTWISELDNKKAQILVDSLSVALTGLHPYRRYSVSIRCMPRDGGFWSEHTRTNFTTLSTAPSHPPEVSTGSYHIYHHHSDFTAIKIFWKALPREDHNGPELGYEAILHTHHGCLPMSAGNIQIKILKKTTCIFHLNKKCKAFVTVNVFNMMNGKHVYPEKRPKALHIDLSQPVVRPRFYVRASSDRNVHVIWDQTTTITSPLPRSVVIFWCKTHTCENGLAWQEFSISSGNATISLPRGQHYSSYSFAVSVDSASLSTGMIWSKCTHDDRIEPARLNIKLTSAQPNLGLNIKWNTGTCAEYRASISNFILAYCPVNTCEEGCSQVDERMITYSNRFTPEHEVLIGDLDPNMYYKVKVIVRSPTGRQSNSSNVVCALVTSSWLTTKVLVLMIFAFTVATILALAGAGFLFRKSKKFHKWCLYGVEITVPDNREKICSTSSQRPLFKPALRLNNGVMIGYEDDCDCSAIPMGCQYDNVGGTTKDSIRDCYRAKPSISLGSDSSMDDNVFTEDNFIVSHSRNGYIEVNLAPRCHALPGVKEEICSPLYVPLEEYSTVCHSNSMVDVTDYKFNDIDKVGVLSKDKCKMRNVENPLYKSCTPEIPISECESKPNCEINVHNIQGKI